MFAINDAFDKGIQEGISVGERKSYHSFDQVTPETMSMKYNQIKSIPEIAIDRQILHQGQELETIVDLVFGTFRSVASL